MSCPDLVIADMADIPVDSGQKVAHYTGQNCRGGVVAEWNLGGASERLMRVLRGTLLIRSTGRGDQFSGTRVLSRRTVACKWPAAISVNSGEEVSQDCADSLFDARCC